MELDAHPPVSPLHARLRQARAALAPQAGTIAISSYIGAQMLSDVASLKIGLVAGLAVDMGTFLYPITFTLRDVVHKLLGRTTARVLIVTAAVVNLFMAGYLAWVARVPPAPTWPYDQAFNDVLGPVWRIVIASIVAEVVSELADTEVYHWFVHRVTHDHQWARVLVSNAVSVPIDNLVFAVLAFAPIAGLPNSLTWATVGQIFVINLAVKGVVTVVSLPLIYTTPDIDWSKQ
jgi:queuosine precursor transporter